MHQLIFGKNLVGVRCQLHEDLHDLRFDMNHAILRPKTIDLRFDFPLGDPEIALQEKAPI